MTSERVPISSKPSNLDCRDSGESFDAHIVAVCKIFEKGRGFCRAPCLAVGLLYTCILQGARQAQGPCCTNPSPRTSGQVLAQHTVSLFLSSSGSSVQDKVVLKGLKKPLKGPRLRQGTCWEEWKRKVSSQWGVVEFGLQANLIFLPLFFIICLFIFFACNLPGKYNCWKYFWSEVKLNCQD